jgi:hypothetical protein
MPPSAAWPATAASPASHKGREDPALALTAGRTAVSSADSGTLGDLRAVAGEDTEDVDRERAETYLRVLAESELRRATTRSPGAPERAVHAARVKRVAQVLTIVGALDDGVADQVLDGFRLALGARQAGAAGQHSLVLRSFTQPTARTQPAAGARPSTAGGPAAAGSGTGMASGWKHAPVPLGQMIAVRGSDVRGEVYLLSYARPASGPQFSVFARTRRPSGPWEPSGPRFFDPFTAIDDRGTSYQVTIRDIGSPQLGWTLMLRPDPPHDPRWLDLTTTSGEPAARISLSPPAGETRTPDATDVTVTQPAFTPGEQLLNTIAARLLAAAPALPHDPWLYGTTPRPVPLASVADGLGDVIAALQDCGALSPLSPLPGQLAALCARLNVSHGITAPPARDLPEPWLSVLAQYQQRETGSAPVRDGCAAATVVLPELDGIRLAILGLHNCQDSTILHMHASDPACHMAYGPIELYSWPPPIWIRDSDGRWHATRTSGRSGMDGDIALRVEVVPPLTRTAAWIEVLAPGLSAQARAKLPLRWESL